MFATTTAHRLGFHRLDSSPYKVCSQGHQGASTYTVQDMPNLREETRCDTCGELQQAAGRPPTCDFCGADSDFMDPIEQALPVLTEGGHRLCTDCGITHTRQHSDTPDWDSI